MPNKEEIFPLNAGFNLYSPQYLLSNHDLAKLLLFSFDEFTQRFPLINVDIVQNFFEILEFKVKINKYFSKI